MANFNTAFRYVMFNEDRNLTGIITNEPPILATDADPKSQTFGQKVVIERPRARFGINSHAHPDAVIDGFYEMDRSAALQYAQKVFLHDYWMPIIGDSIQSDDVAKKFLDLAVNEGVRQATLIVQRSLQDKNVVVDGKVGPKTIAAINSSEPAALLVAIRDLGRTFYTELFERNKARYTEQDYKSWIERLDA